MNNQDLIGRKINLNEIGIIKNYNPITNEFIVKTKTYEVYIDAFKIQDNLVEEYKEESDQIEKFENALEEGIKNSKLNEQCKANEPLYKGFFALAVGNTIEDKIEQLAKELFVKNCLYYIDNALEAQASNAIRAAKAFYNQLNQN